MKQIIATYSWNDTANVGYIRVRLGYSKMPVEKRLEIVRAAIVEFQAEETRLLWQQRELPRRQAEHGQAIADLESGSRDSS